MGWYPFTVLQILYLSFCKLLASSAIPATITGGDEISNTTRFQECFQLHSIVKSPGELNHFLQANPNDCWPGIVSITVNPTQNDERQPRNPGILNRALVVQSAIINLGQVKTLLTLLSKNETKHPHCNLLSWTKGPGLPKDQPVFCVLLGGKLSWQLALS